MTTVELLQQLGLNKYEAEAYYTLLTRGALTGYEVGKYSQVPGSRSYEILERLLEKGLAFVQPGDPPRYRAQNPEEVFARFRSLMEATLDTLASSLASLPQAEALGEFWIVRGQQHILTRMNTMLACAHTSVDLVLPAHCDLAEALALARARGIRVFHASTEMRDKHTFLLLCDDREALLGTITPIDPCQAMLSSNPALLAALRGYFQHQQSAKRAITEGLAGFRRVDGVDWLDWEARKQRHLRNISTRTA